MHDDSGGRDGTSVPLLTGTLRLVIIALSLSRERLAAVQGVDTSRVGVVVPPLPLVLLSSPALEGPLVASPW